MFAPSNFTMEKPIHLQILQYCKYRESVGLGMNLGNGSFVAPRPASMQSRGNAMLAHFPDPFRSPCSIFASHDQKNGREMAFPCSDRHGGRMCRFYRSKNRSIP